MRLGTGSRLGPYEILAPLGAGGMGEVYKARDTRLDRSVAIKILPAALAADPERRRRFEREAHLVAGLNHPRICALHDVGREGDTDFLVMEFVEGQTLAQLLREGPLPLASALAVGIEVADALAAAHHQCIVHRDLKPANIMVTRTGARLLDFGLAKLKEPMAGPEVGRSDLVTGEAMTAPGMVLGTLPYMAPEQLEGKQADARTDLWALGCVLFEMLTGRRAFDGATEASVISSILASEPPELAELRQGTPPALDRLLRRCLAKDPEARWQTAVDLRETLRWLQEPDVRSSKDAAGAARRPLRTTMFWGIGIVAAVLVGAAAAWQMRPVPPGGPMAHVALGIAPAEELNSGTDAVGLLTPAGARTAFTWTPDGRALVFIGRAHGVQQLYLRRLAALDARPLAGTEGAQYLAVSADGQWVAFSTGVAIKKVPIDGGPVADMVSGLENSLVGLAWDAAGRLYYGSRGGPVWMVPPNGAPTAVSKLGEREFAHQLPSVLPGDRALLYTVRRREWTWSDETIVAQAIGGGAPKELLRNAADARYVPTGHLVFLRLGTLWAVPFDPVRLELRGTEVPLLSHVAQALTGLNTWDVTGAGQFAVAPTGVLAWLPGPEPQWPSGTLVSVDRQGRVTTLNAPVRGYALAVRVSPDGRRLLVRIRELTEVGVWVYDLERGTLSPLAGKGEVQSPIWSADGRSLVFNRLADGRPSLERQPADGSAPPQLLRSGRVYPSSFTPDGRRLLADTEPGVPVVLSADDWHAQPQPLHPDLASRPQSGPIVSPDGRWTASCSMVSGRREVFVRPFAAPGPTQLASTQGGSSPAWNPNGREIFFVSSSAGSGSRRVMMAADFAAGDPPRIGRPHALFEFDQVVMSMQCSPTRCYDVSPDGQRFYAVQFAASSRPPAVTHVNLIDNWFEELKMKAPAKWRGGAEGGSR